MTFDAGLVTAVLAVLGGIVWLVRLEGRISRAEERHTDLREVTDEIKRDLKADVYQLHKKLDSGKVYVFRRGSPEDERDT